MSNSVKTLAKPPCTICSHKDVCSYKETYMKILNSISDAVVEQPCTDEKKVQFKKIIDFDFIDSISVTCHYYKNWTDSYCDYGKNRDE
mgnify:CR=1 FL=1